jgi:hypothetical protein
VQPSGCGQSSRKSRDASTGSVAAMTPPKMNARPVTADSFGHQMDPIDNE